MDVAVIIAWFVTAGGGLLMASIWIAKGGLHQEDDDPSIAAGPYGAAEDPGVARTRLSKWMVSTHAVMALVALSLLVFYAARRDDAQTGAEAAPWLAVGSLAVVAGIGVLMVRRWAAYRKAHRRGQPASLRPKPADQSIPAPIVALHGAAAAVTVVLSVLVALKIDT
jgi:heme A synthase